MNRKPMPLWAWILSGGWVVIFFVAWWVMDHGVQIIVSTDSGAYAYIGPKGEGPRCVAIESN
jgi:hypothetical protein